MKRNKKSEEPKIIDTNTGSEKKVKKGLFDSIKDYVLKDIPQDAGDSDPQLEAIADKAIDTKKNLDIEANEAINKFNKGEINKEELDSVLQRIYPDFTPTPDLTGSKKKEKLVPITEIELPKEEKKEETPKISPEEEKKLEEESGKAYTEFNNREEKASERESEIESNPLFDKNKFEEEAKKLNEQYEKEQLKKSLEEEKKAKEEAKNKERQENFKKYFSDAPTIFGAIFDKKSGLTMGQRLSLLGSVIAQTGAASINGYLSAYDKQLPNFTMKGPVYEAVLNAMANRADRLQQEEQAKQNAKNEVTTLNTEIDQLMPPEIKAKDYYQQLIAESKDGPVNEDRYKAIAGTNANDNEYNAYKSAVNSAREIQQNRKVKAETTGTEATTVGQKTTTSSEQAKAKQSYSDLLIKLKDLYTNLKKAYECTSVTDMISAYREALGGLKTLNTTYGTESGTTKQTSSTNTANINADVSYNGGNYGGQTTQTKAGNTVTTINSLFHPILSNLSARLSGGFTHTGNKSNGAHENQRAENGYVEDAEYEFLNEIAKHPENNNALNEIRSAIKDSMDVVSKQIEETEKNKEQIEKEFESYTKYTDDGLIIPDGQVQWIQREDGSRIFLNPDDVVIAVKKVTDKFANDKPKIKDYDYYLNKLRGGKC